MAMVVMGGMCVSLPYVQLSATYYSVKFIDSVCVCVCVFVKLRKKHWKGQNVNGCHGDSGSR